MYFKKKKKTIIRSSLNPLSIFSLQTTLFPPWWTPFFFFFPCIPSIGSVYSAKKKVLGSVWDPKFVCRLAFWVDAESLYYKNKTVKEYISINEIRIYDINKLLKYMYPYGWRGSGILAVYLKWMDEILLRRTFWNSWLFVVLEIITICMRLNCSSYNFSYKPSNTLYMERCQFSYNTLDIWNSWHNFIVYK